MTIWRAGIVLVILQVVSAAPSGAQGRQVSLARPSVLLNGASEDVSRFGPIVVGEAGNVAVAQPTDLRVLYLDGTGQVVRSLGRKGEGPGEFRRISNIGFSGRAIWVEDNLTRRITSFDDDGQSVATPLPTTARMGSAAEPALTSVLAVLPGGQLLERAVMPGNRPFPREWKGRSEAGDELAITAVGTGGQLQRVLGWLGDRGRCMTQIGTMSVRRPLCVEPQLATDGQGSILALVDMEEPADGSFRLRIVETQSGKERVNRRVRGMPLRVPASVYDSIVSGNARYFPPEVIQAMKAGGRPEYFWPVRSLVVSETGAVTVEVWDANADHAYRMFDAQGVERVNFRLPAEEQIAALSTFGILVVREDTDGLQSLLRYPLPEN